MYNLKFVIYFQLTSVRPLRVSITDHVLSMDLQDTFVHVCLDTQVFIVKVRKKLHIRIPNKDIFSKSSKASNS